MLAFDIMGEIAYSKSFDSLATGTEHPAAKAIHVHMKVYAIGSMVPWLLNAASYIPGALAGYQPFFEWCASLITEKKAVRIFLYPNFCYSAKPHLTNSASSRGTQKSTPKTSHPGSSKPSWRKTRLPLPRKDHYKTTAD